HVYVSANISRHPRDRAAQGRVSSTPRSDRSWSEIDRSSGSARPAFRLPERSGGTFFLLPPSESRMFRRLSLACSILVLAWGSSTRAQTVSGTLSGRVLDATRAPIADVTVTVTDLGTNTPSVAATDQTGAYRLTRLSPGAYRIAFEKAGFRPLVRDTVAVAVN